MPFDPSHKINRRCILNLFSEELGDFEGLGICKRIKYALRVKRKGYKIQR